MYVVSVIWLISVFLNVSIVYPGTSGRRGTAEESSSTMEIKFNKRRRRLELNITAWNFLSLITFVVIFLSILLPISVEFNEIRAYVVGVASSFQLGFLGSICMYLLFVSHLQPSAAASVGIWMVGVILTVALIIYDLIVLRLTNDALDLSSRIFAYSTLTSWLVFTFVDWLVLFMLYKKYKKVLNGRRRKLERYMTPRMYLLFLNLKDKVRQLFIASLFLSLSWIPYVLHLIIIAVSAAVGSVSNTTPFEFDWHEKIILGISLTVTNTLIVPLVILTTEETRNNLMRSCFADTKEDDIKCRATTKSMSINTVQETIGKCNYSFREIGNVGLVNIPEMCLTDKLNGGDKKMNKFSNESDA